MDFRIDRRSILKAGAALAAAYAVGARAQAKPTIRFAAVFSDKDITRGHDPDAREGTSTPTSRCSLSITIVVQAGHGTGRPAARQPGDGNIAPQDISNQVPRGRS